MLGTCWLLLAAAFAAPSQAEEPPAGHVVHEQRSLPLSDWKRASRLEASAIVPVRIGLSQTNLDKGHDLLMEVSHPESPKYGQWWSAQDLHEFFAPADETVEMVRSWIKSVGIEDERVVHSDNKGWLAVDATVGEAELLLRTKFYEYEHSHHDGLRIGTDKYHVPEHLARHIDYVTPGLKLVPIRKRNVRGVRREALNGPARMPPRAIAEAEHDIFRRQDMPEPTLEWCWYMMHATCWRVMYGIPSDIPAVPGHSVGVYESYTTFDKVDLDMYYTKYAQWVPNGTYPIPALINGATYDYALNDSHIDAEPIMDIVILQSLVYPQNVTVYQVDDEIYAQKEPTNSWRFNTLLDALDGSYCTYSAYGETGNDPNLDAMYPNPNRTGYQGQLMCGVYKPTKVISFSYGEAENDLPPNYMKRQCNEFLKLGLMGTSLVFASGDTGVATFQGDGTESGCLGPKGTIFAPTYPNNCPWITSVGATQLNNYQKVNESESVMYMNLTGTLQNFTSGGGFSNVYPQASYQKAAVEHYFEKYSPPYPYYSEFEPDFSKVKGLYNRLGRGYPDVSANGAWMPLFTNGSIGAHWGTSIAAPIFASVLVLLNEERALAGKSSIGFANPTFYAHPEIFNDIVNGTSRGCGTFGFSPVPGWDPSTGLGTPNYPKMRELFLSLP